MLPIKKTFILVYRNPGLKMIDNGNRNTFSYLMVYMDNIFHIQFFLWLHEKLWMYHVWTLNRLKYDITELIFTLSFLMHALVFLCLRWKKLHIKVSLKDKKWSAYINERSLKIITFFNTVIINNLTKMLWTKEKILRIYVQMLRIKMYTWNLENKSSPTMGTIFGVH